MRYPIRDLYITKLQNFQISNELITVIFLIIESLPIIYHSFLASFSLGNRLPPSNVMKYGKYFSYYACIKKYINSKEMLIYYLIGIGGLFSVFLLYYYLKQKDIRVIDHFLINFFEFGVCRILMILILDIVLFGINYNSLINSLISLILLSVILIISLIHIYKSKIYLKPFNIRTNFQVDSLLNVIDYFQLFQKVFICLIENSKDSEDGNTFMTVLFSAILITLNLLCFFYSNYLIFFHKYVFVYDRKDSAYAYGKTTFIFLIHVIVLVFRISNEVIIGISLFKSILLSILLFYLVKRLSFLKLLKKGNELPFIVYLINVKADSSQKIKILYELIKNHFADCQQKECSLCEALLKSKAKTSKFVETKKTKDKRCFEELISKTFSQLIKKKIFQNSKLSSNDIIYYNLVKFYLSNFKENSNMLAISLKYHRMTKMKYHFKTKDIFSEKLKFKTLKENFNINLSVIYNDLMANFLYAEGDSKNLKYLIQINQTIRNISELVKKVKNFIYLKLKAPKDIIKLSEDYSKLKNSITPECLNQNYSKSNYQCLLCGYILEELLHQTVSKTTNFTDLVHQFDDFLKTSFLKDAFILAEFDFSEQILKIRQCGKELISFKNKNFPSLFPVYLRSYGKKKLFEYIAKKQKTPFCFYIEIDNSFMSAKFSFINIPFLDDISKIYLGCSYRISNEKLFLVEKQEKVFAKERKILCGCNLIENYNDLTIEQLKDKTTIEDSNKKPNKKFILREKTQKFELILKEEIDSRYEILKLNEEKAVSKFKAKETIKTINATFENSTGIALHFAQQQTTVTTNSSTWTNSSLTSLAAQRSYLNKEKKTEFKKFRLYSFYIIGFNALILIIVGVFLTVELMNNQVLQNFFNIITNFNNYQNYYYHTSLSLFSLMCIPDELDSNECSNNFKQLSEQFALEHGLSNNQLIYEYITKEIPIKSNLILGTLNDWIRDKNKINIEAIQAITEDNFDFYSIQELNGTLSSSKKVISFSEAMKTYVDLVNIIPTMSDYFEVPIFVITIDGKGLIDLSNVLYGLIPQNGIYLKDSQRYFYTMLVNFQQYIVKFNGVSDILFETYNSKLKNTKIQITIFIIFFITLHLIMMIVAINFILKYKSTYVSYYKLLYKKLSSSEFINYFKNKIALISELLDLYSKDPVLLINSINKTIKKEKETLNDKAKANKITLALDNIDETLKENDKKISNKFFKLICLRYLIYSVLCIALYIVIEILFIIFGYHSINDLTLTSTYSNKSYQLTNKMYINLCLLQVMAVTNQTDLEMESYFGGTQLNNSTLTSNDAKKAGYVKGKIEEINQIILDTGGLETKKSQFQSITEMLSEINCEDIYNKFNDPIVTEINELYPEINYNEMLMKYCSTISGISEYKNDKLSYFDVIYKQSKLLHMFKDREYKTHTLISQSTLIFDLYDELLLVTRPIRRYLYTFMSKNVVSVQINSYSITIIIFIIVNFIYDCWFLLYLKAYVINNIIKKLKEIIIVAKSFECI